ncbi:hypothetical protein BJY01DRAFT_223926 [Aspergillus pseudoustus]|uniref:Uncharacterized protein n=1 Tax=Aspergillus pseudoustus TaxID=1810923 RepID=A0ABR4J447_9EURO
MYYAISNTHFASLQTAGYWQPAVIVVWFGFGPATPVTCYTLSMVSATAIRLLRLRRMGSCWLQGRLTPR